MNINQIKLNQQIWTIRVYGTMFRRLRVRSDGQVRLVQAPELRGVKRWVLSCFGWPEDAEDTRNDLMWVIHSDSWHYFRLFSTFSSSDLKPASHIGNLRNHEIIIRLSFAWHQVSSQFLWGASLQSCHEVLWMPMFHDIPWFSRNILEHHDIKKRASLSLTGAWWSAVDHTVPGIKHNQRFWHRSCSKNHRSWDVSWVTSWRGIYLPQHERRQRVPSSNPWGLETDRVTIQDIQDIQDPLQ